MKKFWEDFKKFIKRGNVVDMAVGVAVASAFTAIVTAFTKGVINPLLALLSPASNQEDGLKTILRPEITSVDPTTGETIIEQSEIALLWGPIIQAVTNFFIVAFFLFLVMRIAAAVAARGAKVRAALMTDEEKQALADAEAKAKADEAAAKAKAEAEAAAAEAKLVAEEERKKREEALLTEICSLLREMNKK